MIIDFFQDHQNVGVAFSDDLRWNCHISRVFAKANRVIYPEKPVQMLKKNKQSAYFILLRPDLEHVSSACDPHRNSSVAYLGYRRGGARI